MLRLRDKDRVRILAAVARKGPQYTFRRVATITLSLLILLAVPLAGIFRIDLWQGNHILLGESVDAVTALKGFVVSMAVLYGVTFLSNVFVGRFFCGWGCPVGYVSRLAEDVELAQRRKQPLWAAFHLVSGAGFTATFVGAVMLWWVDPRVMLEGSATARLVTLGVFLVLSIGGFLHAFGWRFGFCLHLCPIGLYYRLVTSRAPIGIELMTVPDPCIECGACEKICPMSLDPKRLGEELPALSGDPNDGTRYGDAECIRCGDCVEACAMVFRSREGEMAPLRFVRHGAEGVEADDQAGKKPQTPAAPV